MPNIIHMVFVKFSTLKLIFQVVTINMPSRLQYLLNTSAMGFYLAVQAMEWKGFVSMEMMCLPCIML